MKFDLHCHTREGSIDSKVALKKYIKLLADQGFDGMMITDHDTYRGCSFWEEIKKDIKKDPKYSDFVVLKGVEYDTKDAGHILVVMPDDVYLHVLTLRGMTLRRLMKIVRHYGGILGPAHPFGVKSSSAMFFKKLKYDPNIAKKFDFIETFNTCESARSNEMARMMANMYQKPGFGGSDAHEDKYVGMAYTQINADIRSNNDLIRALKEGAYVTCGGTERKKTKKSTHKNMRYAIWGFKFYNRGLGYLFSPYRKYKIRKLAI